MSTEIATVSEKGEALLDHLRELEGQAGTDKQLRFNPLLASWVSDALFRGEDVVLKEALSLMKMIEDLIDARTDDENYDFQLGYMKGLSVVLENALPRAIPVELIDEYRQHIAHSNVLMAAFKGPETVAKLDKSMHMEESFDWLKANGALRGAGYDYRSTWEITPRGEALVHAARRRTLELQREPKY